MFKQATRTFLRQAVCPRLQQHLSLTAAISNKPYSAQCSFAFAKRTVATTASWWSDKSMDRERQRQLAQDDVKEEIADHGRLSVEEEEGKEGKAKKQLAADRAEIGAELAPEIERLDPQSVPGLYPEFDMTEGQEEGESAVEGDDSWYIDTEFGEQDKVNVPLWQRRAAENLGDGRAPKRTVDVGEFADGSLFDLCCHVLEADSSVSIIDVSDRCEWTSKMVIAEAKGTRHMRAIAEGLLKAIKERNRQRGGPTALNVDGRDSDDWMVVDLGSFVVHIMIPEARKTYDLEALWAPAPAPEDQGVGAAAAGDSNASAPDASKKDE